MVTCNLIYRYFKVLRDIPSLYLRSLFQGFGSALFLMCILMVLGSIDVQGQQRVPRVGFPYCQTFVGTENNLPRFEDLKSGGDFLLTGVSASLTQTDTVQTNGYFYIDIPFFPRNGIQVSFDYFIYGGVKGPTPLLPNGSLGADGLTFFMFDGRYGDLPPPNTFNIGATGGALGYASRLKTVGGVTSVIPGVSGGYIGLGIDVWGNYLSLEDNFDTVDGDGNTVFNRKQTGIPYFDNPHGLPSLAPFPQTVAIRGPEDTQYDIPAPVGNYYVDVFNRDNRLLNNDRTDDCFSADYRRVYLSLEPIGTGGYTLTVEMLFGNQIVTILSQPYNFEPPPVIKLGFSAATGSEVNHHEIRNLAVGIFEPDPLTIPIAEDTEIRACEGDEVEFELPLDRILSPNSFIQCIELFLTRPDPVNAQDGTALHLNCAENQNICNVCLNIDYTEGLVVPNFGTFYVEDIADDVDLENLGDEKVTIRFVPFELSPTRLNSGSIFYTVTDNFGITSNAAEFKVIINPIPEFVTDPVVEDPTCDGQSDGRITAQVQNLVEGFEHEWFFEDFQGNRVERGPQEVTAMVDGTATFTINGISTGDYFLVVRNPQSNPGEDDFCEDELKAIAVTNELGTPVEVDQDRFEICEGDEVRVIATLGGNTTVSPGITPVFLWYNTSDTSNDPIVTSIDTPVTIDGAVYTATTDGALMIQGLSSAGTGPLEYDFYVQVRESRAGDADLCEIGGELDVAFSVGVYPEITFNVLSEQEDWCLDNSGSINLVANRGNESVSSYTLLDRDLAELRPAQGSGEFNNLPKGEYTVKVEVIEPFCEDYFDFEIDGPEEELSITVNADDPTCELDNGSITWEVSGGNGGYEMVSIEGYPNGITPTVTQTGQFGEFFTIENLISTDSPYTLRLTVKDSEGCTIPGDGEIAPQVLPFYELEDQVICIDGGTSITPDATLSGSPNPGTVFRWFTDSGATEEIFPGVNATIGAEFEINSNTGELKVKEFENDGTYTFYMKPEVLNGCDMPVVDVTITVNPLPAPVFEEIEPTCFGLSDGKLRLVSGGQAEYSYELVGSSVTFDGTDFDGIPAGDYIIRVTNTVTQCTIDFPGLMEQPDLLTIQQVSLQDPTCGFDNGVIAYSFAGGTSDYEVFLNGQLVTTHTETEMSATQQITDLAGGSYTLRIEDANGCFAEFTFDMSPLDFPQFAVTDAVICELDPTSANRDFLTATVSPVVVNLSNAVPSYAWYYLDGAGNEVQIQNGSTVFGANATIDGSANLSLQGLAANADPYIVYLRVTGDFVCDNSLIPSEILVNPLPSPVFVVEDATCFGESDGRLVLDSDGSDDYTYELLSSGIAFDGTSFDGLSAGNYTIRVTNIVTNCFDDFVLTVGQPDQLQLLEVELVDPTCEIDNGILRYRFIGGTGDYTVFLDGAEIGVFEASQLDQVLEITDLAGGTYTLSIVDLNGCDDEFEFTLNPRELPEFAVTDAVICELDPLDPERAFLTATVSPVTVTLSNAVPVYNWYYLDGAGNEVQIQDGDLVFGAAASINAAGELSLQGLEANLEPYMVYLQVTGDNVCDNSLIPSEILVNPLPAPVFTVEDASCFEGSDGSLILESGGSDDYTYEILSSTVAFDGTAFVRLPAGVYTIRATNSITNCFDEFEYEINQPEELLLLEIDSEDPTCGQPNGEISFRVTGGTPDYSISINGEDLGSFEHNISGTGRIFVRGLEPGTYTVSVIDDNECVAEQVDWITLTNNDGEEVTAIPDEIIICEGGVAVLEPEITVGGGLTPTLTWYFDANLTEPIAAGTDAEGVDYSFAADGSMQVSGLAEGNYEYFVRIGGDGICVTSTFGTVEVLAPLLADVEVVDIICFGEENGVIRVTDLSGGTGDYDFSLDGTNWQEENEFTDLAPGTYTVSIRDNSQLEGCILEIPGVEIASPPGPIELIDFERFAESCEDANGEIFNIQISGGWGAYQHEWRKDDPLTGPSLTGSLTEIRDLEAGIYYLIVTDEKGCEAIFDFEILVAPDPQYIVLPPIDECEGNDVLLAPLHVAVNPNTPSARTNVSWYKGANQTGLIEEGVDPNDAGVSYTIDDSDYLNPKLTISGLAPGTYTYYFFVECTGDEMPISVSIDPTPDVVFETSDETCFGDNDGKIRILSGHQSGHQYTIGNTSYTAEELESQNFEGGVYDIEVLSTNGCFQIAQVEIEAATALTLDLVDFKNAACGVDDGFIEVRVGGGRAPYELLLTETNSGNTSTLTGNGPEFKFDNLSQGNYTVQVIDDSGCDTVLANPIEVEDGPSEILLDDEYFICEDEEIELSPGVNPANANARFNWYLNSVSPANAISDGQTINGATVSINNDGSRFGVAGLTLSDSPVRLFVTVEGPGICEGDVVETRIVVLGTPEVTASKQDEVCFGDLGQIFLSPAAGSGQLEYSVNGGNFQTYNNNVIEDLTPGDYQITARNQGGCAVDLPLISIEGPTEALRIEDFGNVGASCEEDNGVIFGEVFGGDLPYILQIRSGGQQINKPIDWDNGRFTVSELALGTYEITIIDSRGCEIVAGTTEVTDEPTPIAVDNVTICEGEVAELRPYIPGVPSSPGFRWFMDASKSTAIPVGTSQADGKTFELSNNGVLRISGLRADEAPYNYFVELALSGSCELELAEAIVDVNPLPQLRTFNPSLVCDPNETVNLTNFIDNFNPNVYDYEVVSPSGSIMRLDELATVSSSGTYIVRASFKNSSCFTNQERIIVRIANEELSSFFNYELDLGGGTIAVNEDIGIDEEVSFKDDTSGEPIAWEWDFGDGNTSTEQNPTHVYTEKGAYTITLTTYSAIGCISVYQRVIDVFDDYLIIFPNAFTPKREDGKNVLFYPKYRGLAELKVYIFNTWGDLIYESENFEQGGWDGMLNGEEVPNGNYVYKAEFMSRGGDRGTRTGVFILIK
ncbi:gliding motility-associated-like protein [Mongoliibacter ruber]|uniref:Gliding motility-associated-like protein n=2 Tax=Mongoliibacter ruber TaxID=1750599 RepID=A0A2T0WNW4_9BACT|nr:gliding motility-associated-like protein [Mongoliibacter ruber]